MEHHRKGELHPMREYGAVDSLSSRVRGKGLLYVMLRLGKATSREDLAQA